MSEDEKRLLLLKEQEEYKKKLEQEEKIKQDIANKSKPTCTIRGRFLFDSPRCPGHGDGGGGSEETSKNDDVKSSIVSGPISSAALSDGVVNPEVIARLLATNVFTITNDRENGELLLKIDPNKWCELSAEERQHLQNFIRLVLGVFNEFKDQLDPSDKNKCFCTIETDPQNKNNIFSLNIKILDPTLKLYDKFIQRLTGAIQRLSNNKDDPAIDLILLLFQDGSKISNEIKEAAKSKFLNSFENENQNFREPQQEKNPKISPFQTKPTPNGVKRNKGTDYL